MIDGRELSDTNHQTNKDSVLDKHAWHEAVENAIKSAEASEQPLTVLFIDVNHFKAINDDIGHEAGDEVIIALRDILAKNLRTVNEGEVLRTNDLISVSETQPQEKFDSEMSSDLQAGHIGGDEFAVLCRTDDIGARLIEDRLRNAFNNYVNLQNNKLMNLDISLAIGIAVFQPGMTSSQLLHTADREMFEDKLRQLPPLTEEQVYLLSNVYEKLGEHNIRLRDLGKYAIILSRQLNI